MSDVHPALSKGSDAPAFDISPEVVFRLGEELITDELQALVELIKNSYDASATSVVVHVDSKSPGITDPAPKGVTPTGWVEVCDDGDGMTRQQVDDGWLLISTSGKRAMKEQGQTNRLGRTPLGDKGLGRLGVLRLGQQVEIRTRPRGVAEEHVLRFNRSDFEHEHALSDVHPHYERRDLKKQKDAPGGWRLASPFDSDVSCGPVQHRHGTVIRVSGLTNAQIWQDRVRVQHEMLSLISPFRDIENFDLTVYLDDPASHDPLPLGKLADIRRDLADLRWSFGFDGERLTATGRFKLSAFEPSKDPLRAFWSSYVAPDRGAAYRHRLASGPLAPHGTDAPDAPWWLSVTFSVALSDIVLSERRPRLRKDDEAVVGWADPGPFSGELDSFYLGRDRDKDDRDAIFDSFELYRRWVHEVRGIKVFRDGFGIRVDDDFLSLGLGSTAGRSFWALRPGNVVGHVELSAGHNAQLQETTDREGFVVSPPYRAFTALLQTLVDRINLIQTQIGRELREWADEVSLPVTEPPSRKASELANEAAAREQQTREASAAVASVQRTLKEMGDGSALLTPEQATEARAAGALLERLRKLIHEGESLRSDLDELAVSTEAIELERAQLRDQLRVAYQTVGLGIVAETVAHEMTNITGRLQAQTDAMAPNFKGPEHRAARALVSEIKTTVRAIRLQLRHLEPQLRYQRTRREVLDILAAVHQVADYHRDRLATEGFEVTVSGTSFQARLNPGRLQQALDNLFINSEFWLRHAQTEHPRIDITVGESVVRVHDNGPGVDPGLETAIFDPFVSGRTGEEGRGLGLFIARQVLNDDDAAIYFGERGEDGRHRTFVLDFTGAIPDDTDA